MKDEAKEEEILKINHIHPLLPDQADFIHIQERLSGQVDVSRPLRRHDVRMVAGVDLAYDDDGDVETGFCHIAVYDLSSMEVIERTEAIGQISVPYIPGFLTFRELPLIVEAAGKLEKVPELFMFDGNGILHPRRLGIAAHASFFLDRPTLGVAKTYFKVGDTDYGEPDREKGSYTDIIVDDQTLGRAVRTSKDVKPVFVSPGNGLDLDSATDITLALSNAESRLPMPVREADIATRRMRRNWKEDRDKTRDS